MRKKEPGLWPGFFVQPPLRAERGHIPPIQPPPAAAGGSVAGAWQARGAGAQERKASSGPGRTQKTEKLVRFWLTAPTRGELLLAERDEQDRQSEEDRHAQEM